MKDSSIHFFKENVSFQLLKQDGLKQWIRKAFKENHVVVKELNYIFCSDKYLLKMNKEYLNQNYLTDIITFDNSTVKGNAEADIFISSDRIKANAKKFKTTFRNELHRVMIHGALHLIGYNDKSPEEEKVMREAENYWLQKRNF